MIRWKPVGAVQQGHPRMDKIMLAVAFWSAACLVVYIYLGYPLLVWILSKRRPSDEAECLESPVSVVIVAYNEAARLTRKIDSILAADGSLAVVEIIVASDGSTDDTCQLLQDHRDSRVRLLHFDQRRGKPAVLNDAIAQCTTDIVVLTDARQEFHPAALTALIGRLSDPGVGVVSGNLVFRQTEDETTTARGVGVYWKYEKFIRNHESQWRSVPGATGALYAIRKDLFHPIAAQTLLDDVVIPMQAIERGYRCVFEPRAIIYDDPASSSRQEVVRKRRTIAGCAQLVLRQPRWLFPWSNPIWIEYVSHKIARLVSPALLVVMLVANAALAGQPAYRVLLSVHICFYLAALSGYLIQRSGQRSPCFAAPLLFLTLNLTTVLALWDACRGRFRATWQKAT